MELIGSERVTRAVARRKISQGLVRSSVLLFSSSKKDLPMFEHFLVVGRPPDGSPDPKILFIYPSSPLLFSQSDFDQVAKFCFPAITPKTGDKEKFESSNCVKSYFIFRWNACDVYGFCLHIRMNPRDLPPFVSEKTVDDDFCLCILSKNPICAPYFHYLVYFSFIVSRRLLPFKAKYDEDVGQVNQSREQQAIPVDSGSSLEGLQVSLEHGYAAWPSEQPIHVKWTKELGYFRRQHVSDFVNRECALAKGFTLVIPREMAPHEALAQPLLEILFSVMDSKDIVTLYKTMMLEKHIIFVSQSVDTVTMCVLAAKSLMYPFIGGYSQTTIPILPAWASQFLASPIPYMVGVTEIPSGMEFDDVLVVNLDEGRLEGHILDIEMPREKELLSNVNTILRDNREAITKPPPQVAVLFSKPTPNPKYSTFMKSISQQNLPLLFHKSSNMKYVFPPKVTLSLLRLFNDHICKPLEETIIACFVTEMTDIKNPVTVFNPDVFRAMCDPVEMDFYDHFISTSLFQLYCDEKTDEIERKKADMGKRRHITLAEVHPKKSKRPPFPKPSHPHSDTDE